MRARPSDWQPAATLTVLEHDNTFFRQLRNSWRTLRHSRQHGNLVIIPNVDEKLPQLILLRPFFRKVDVRGIVMRPPKSGTRTLTSWVKGSLITVARRLKIQLVYLTSPFEKANQEHLLFDPSGIISMPQVTVSQPDASIRILEWKASDPRPVVGLIGVLNERKSVLEVIDALSTPAAQAQFRVLVAGQPAAPDYRQALQARADALPTNDGLFLLTGLTDAELESALDATDLLALVYTNEVGSSGLLAHGTRRGQKIVGLKNQVINRAITSYGLGAIATGTQPTELLSAFSAALNTPSADASNNSYLETDCKRQWHALTKP